MKTAVLLLCCLAATYAIRVPSSWHSKEYRNGNPVDKHRNYHNSHPLPYKSRRSNLKQKHYKPKSFYVHNMQEDGWIPIIPKHKHYKTRPYQHHKNKIHHHPLYKNYRDDKTHEYHESSYKPHYDPEVPQFDRSKAEKAPVSYHEDPPEPPTRPIYPGEGQWAKKGKKHRPYIRPKHPQPEEEEEEPEGYDTFLEGEKNFNQQRNNFEKSFESFPRKHNLDVKSNHDHEDLDEDDEDEEGEKVFTPTRLYAQVRRSETEDYEPAGPDPRLKETIKDSKIQTVYTEEGYEDAEYDHAGHIKKAENDEGDAQFDKGEEKETEVKAPHVVYALHESSNFNDEEDDENLEDSDSAGSEYQPKSKMNKKNNFIKTKATKTMAVKDKGNGTMQMEISSNVKVLHQPNNSTKLHKYVKIFPKIFRNVTEAPEQVELVREEAFEQIYPEKSTVSAALEGTDIAPTEQTVEATTELQATSTETEEASNESEIEAIVHNIDSTFKKIRRKRDADFFPNIEVDTDFIDAIEHNIPEPSTTTSKYPYYKDEKLQDSPLRYSENPENIPRKEEGNMAFYEQADKKVQCPEVETEVDPIPDRIKNIEQRAEAQEESQDIAELVEGQRLGKLGDKIDCFKIKYFGENPLDNPIFQEELVEPVKPIFKIKKHEDNEIMPPTVEPNAKELDRLDINILTDVISNVKKNETESKSETTTIPTVSIITTPNYTVNITPKHIYDQIDLLDYLPRREEGGEEERDPKTLNESNLKTTSQTPDVTEAASNLETLPDSQALIQRRRRRFRTRRPYIPFDRFHATTPFPYLNNHISTVLPKYKVISEVFYKDEIKPSEQLNVFADIINNIKNSSANSDLEAASDYSDQMSLRLNTNKKVKSKRIRIRNSDPNESSLNQIKPAVNNVRTRMKPQQHKNVDQFYEEYLLSLKDTDSESADSNLESQYVEPIKKRRRITTTTTTTKKPDEDVTDEEENEEGDNTNVLGLMPPANHRYKTIYTKPAFEDLDGEEELNRFLVPGMKPPPVQKVLLYSDFKLKKNYGRRRAVLRRGKRNANRPAYSEFSRSRGKQGQEPVQDDDDDDDYVPHRPKNYHYDEKLKRIVYDNVKKEEEEVDDVEYEDYEEVTEKPKTKSRNRNKVTTTTFKPLIATSPPPGKGLLDYLKKVREDPRYVAIPDPTTTEKSSEPSTTTTTIKPESTTPPAFLSILAKVKSDSHYKFIEDPKEKKSKSTTTTEAPEYEDDEDDEEDQVQNAPGGQSRPSFEVFDINGYLPNVKTYTPRTTIDYSKYKTIERPSTRHNLSSRYDSGDKLDEINTTQVPRMRGKTETASNPEESESRYPEDEEEEEVKTEPTITTTTTTTTTKRTRGRRPVSRTTQRNTEPTTTERIVLNHEKPKRNYRRRPTRIKIRTTTDRYFDEEEDETTKTVRRRSRSETSIEHRQPKLEPIIVEDEDYDMLDYPFMEDRMDSNAEDRKARIQTPEDALKIINETSRPGEIEPRNFKVDVFKKYDKTKKHGGNYKKIEAVKERDQQGKEAMKEVKRLVDVVPKPVAFYSDPKLPKTINQLKEVDDTALEQVDNLDGDVEREEGVEMDFGDYEDVEINVRRNDEGQSEEEDKKIVIIKDPSKRLYYYAPV